LEGIGFVEIRPSGASKMGFAFIPNPHDVIFRLRAAKTDPTAPPERKELAGGLTEGSFNAFIERALELGCNDVKAMLESPPPSPPSEAASSPKRPTRSKTKRPGLAT
jgi:hypothetical protein